MVVSPFRALLAAHGQATWNRSARELGRQGAWALALVVGILALFGAFGLLLGGGALGWLLGGRLERPVVITILGTLLAFLGIGGGLIGGVLGGARELAWEAYRGFPLRLRTLYLAELTAGLADMLPMTMGLALTGLLIGLGLAAPSTLPLLPFLLLETLLMLLALQLLVGGLAAALVKRLRLALVGLGILAWLGSTLMSPGLPKRGAGAVHPPPPGRPDREGAGPGPGRRPRAGGPAHPRRRPEPGQGAGRAVGRGPGPAPLSPGPAGAGDGPGRPDHGAGDERHRGRTDDPQARPPVELPPSRGGPGAAAFPDPHAQPPGPLRLPHAPHDRGAAEGPLRPVQGQPPVDRARGLRLPVPGGEQLRVQPVRPGPARGEEPAPPARGLGGSAQGEAAGPGRPPGAPGPGAGGPAAGRGPRGPRPAPGRHAAHGLHLPGPDRPWGSGPPPGRRGPWPWTASRTTTCPSPWAC